jgi:hypothetical protein
LAVAGYRPMIVYFWEYRSLWDFQNKHKDRRTQGNLGLLHLRHRDCRFLGGVWGSAWLGKRLISLTVGKRTVYEEQLVAPNTPRGSRASKENLI